MLTIDTLTGMDVDELQHVTNGEDYLAWYELSPDDRALVQTVGEMVTTIVPFDVIRQVQVYAARGYWILQVKVPSAQEDDRVVLDLAFTERMDAQVAGNKVLEWLGETV